MPIVVWLIEWIFIVLFAVFMFTQVIMPAVENRPLFPFFRPRRKLERKLTEARGEVSDAQLRREIDMTEDQAEQTHASGRRK